MTPDNLQHFIAAAPVSPLSQADELALMKGSLIAAQKSKASFHILRLAADVTALVTSGQQTQREALPERQKRMFDFWARMLWRTTHCGQVKN